MPPPGDFWKQVQDYDDLYTCLVIGIDFECRGIYHRGDAFGILYSLINQAESYCLYREMNIDLGEDLYILAEKHDGRINASLRAHDSTLCSSKMLLEQEFYDYLNSLIYSVRDSLSRCGIDVSQALEDYPPTAHAEYWLSENKK